MNKQLIFRNCFLTAVLASILFSCTTTKLTPDELGKVRNLQPPPGKALVYFVRPVAAGALLRMHISCDGNSIGSTQGKQFIYAFIDPGQHMFRSKAENKDDLSMLTEPGKTYYFEQIPEMGFFVARNRLERIEDSKGQEKLAKCKMSSKCPAYSMQHNSLPK